MTTYGFDSALLALLNRTLREPIYEAFHGAYTRCYQHVKAEAEAKACGAAVDSGAMLLEVAVKFQASMNEVRCYKTASGVHFVDVHASALQARMVENSVQNAPQDLVWFWTARYYEAKRNPVAFRSSEHLVAPSAWCVRTLRFLAAALYDVPNLFDPVERVRVRVEQLERVHALIQHAIAEATQSLVRFDLVLGVPLGRQSLAPMSFAAAGAASAPPAAAVASAQVHVVPEPSSGSYLEPRASSSRLRGEPSEQKRGGGSGGSGGRAPSPGREAYLPREREQQPRTAVSPRHSEEREVAEREALRRREKERADEAQAQSQVQSQVQAQARARAAAAFRDRQRDELRRRDEQQAQTAQLTQLIAQLTTAVASSQASTERLVQRVADDSRRQLSGLRDELERLRQQPPASPAPSISLPPSSSSSFSASSSAYGPSLAARPAGPSRTYASNGTSNGASLHMAGSGPSVFDGPGAPSAPSAPSSSAAASSSSRPGASSGSSLGARVSVDLLSRDSLEALEDEAIEMLETRATAPVRLVAKPAPPTLSKLPGEDDDEALFRDREEASRAVPPLRPSDGPTLPATV